MVKWSTSYNKYICAQNEEIAINIKNTFQQIFMAIEIKKMLTTYIEEGLTKEGGWVICRETSVFLFLNKTPK